MHHTSVSLAPYTKSDSKYGVNKKSSSTNEFEPRKITSNNMKISTSSYV